MLSKIEKWVGVSFDLLHCLDFRIEMTHEQLGLFASQIVAQQNRLHQSRGRLQFKR